MIFHDFFQKVLSKLPAVVDTGNDITASHSGDVSTTSVISSGIIQEFNNAGSIDWSQSSHVVTGQTTESFDWSTPVSAPVEDELVLTYSDDDDDDDDDKDDDGDTDEEVDPDDVKEKDGDVSSDGNKTLIDVDQVCEFFYLYCNSP